jgi:hypothetical protein
MNIIENIDKIKWNFYRKLSWKTVVWLEYRRLSLKSLRFKIKKLVMNKLIEPVISRYKIMMIKRKLNRLPKECVI